MKPTKHLICCSLAVVLFAFYFAASAAELTTPVPAPGKPSTQKYQVAWYPGAKLELDGRANERIWYFANADKRFVFPWKETTAPETLFRAVCDGTNLWFTFRVTDSDVVALEKLRDEEDEVFEDRVEVYLSRDEAMKDYFCFEVDSHGRVFDYRASFYRKLDTKWTFPGLEARGATNNDGYVVEGKIPLKSFADLGFPPIEPGSRILCGLYRAEFSHDRTGKKVEQTASLHNLGRKVEGPPPIEEWISWVDPKVKEPDFHIPATLGWLEFGKPATASH
jgi:hypothetical protein